MTELALVVTPTSVTDADVSGTFGPARNQLSSAYVVGAAHAGSAPVGVRSSS